MVTTDENKERWKRFVVDVLNQGNLDALGEYFAADVNDYSLPSGYSGYEGLEAFLMQLLEAFPDIEYHVEDLIGEGDKVVCRSSWTGTHKSTFLGLEATGRRVRVSGIDICRFVEGRVVDHWGAFDVDGLMEQLGKPRRVKPTDN